MSTQTRQPAGVPVGGQFATSARAESSVTLDAPAAAEAPTVQEDLAPALDMNRVAAENHIRSLIDAAAVDGDPERIDQIASLASGPGWKGVAYVRGYPSTGNPESPSTDYLPTKAGATRVAEYAWDRTGPAERNAQDNADTAPPADMTDADMSQMIATQVIETFETVRASDSPLKTSAAVRMAVAAEDLEQHLAAGPRAPLTAAREAFLDADRYRLEGAANVLHAELVDALSEAPTRQQVADLTTRLSRAKSDVVDVSVGRDLGNSTDADVTRFRNAANIADGNLANAKSQRRLDRSRRLLSNRPTLYDMLDAQEYADETRLMRRTAVNAADAARGVYTATEHDNPELARRTLAADHATRAEAEKIDAYEQAKCELAVANRIWAQRPAFFPHTSAT